MKKLIIAAAVCCGVLSSASMAAVPSGICAQGGAFTMSETLSHPVLPNGFPFNYAADNMIHMTNGAWSGTTWTYTNAANCVSFNITPHVTNTTGGSSARTDNYISFNPNLVTGSMKGNTLKVKVTQNVFPSKIFCVTSATMNGSSTGITVNKSANCSS
ncbi:MAG: hypothetical protein NTZ67_06900 [Gammaproteobacteria bacterium]|nr:hypothetical protein [Gammaproteobacteria bacterium]